MTGYIQNYDGQCLTIIVPYADNRLLERQQITECEVILRDGRSLSPLQRNKIFALINDITTYVSGLDAKRLVLHETLCAMQLNYLISISPDTVRYQLTQNYCRLSNIDLFSLAQRGPDTVDMTTARDFIDWLVELCVMHGIPCQDTLLNRCEDVGRYLYACVMNRRCCLCGSKAHIHEFDRVGDGRNRRKIHHSGQRVQPLCADHHKEVHDTGQKTFDAKYHLQWVRLDDAACEQLKWRI